MPEEKIDWSKAEEFVSTKKAAKEPKRGRTRVQAVTLPGDRVVYRNVDGTGGIGEIDATRFAANWKKAEKKSADAK